MQVAIALPDHECDPDRVQEAELDLPIRKIRCIDHAGDQWDRDTEKRDQDQPETDIIHISDIIRLVRRLFYTIHHSAIGLCKLLLAGINFRK